MRFLHTLRIMLSQLRMFLVALEEGSLNRAAVRLRMSQSALSRQMQALEREVGGPLFERTASGIRPTDAGYALVKNVPALLSAYDDTMAEARRLVRGQREILRIGYLGSSAQKFLDPALAILRKSHSEVKVRLFDYSPGEQIAALRQGQIDVAVTGQEGGMASSEFYIRKLATMPVVAVLPADHRYATKSSISLKQLKGECFLSTPEEDLPGRDQWIIQLCRRAGFRPTFVQQADTVSRMFTLVSSEGAIALAPAYLKDFPAAGVVMVQLEDAKATWDFLVVWQRGKASVALQAFLDALGDSASDACGDG